MDTELVGDSFITCNVWHLEHTVSDCDDGETDDDEKFRSTLTESSFKTS